MSGKLSLLEKLGYGAGDIAANIVFMTMILFQTSFYTEVFGISAAAAATVLLVARLWDAFADPIVGALADRTHTRWGKFRPWILATAVPWSLAMVLAYTTPGGWSKSALIAYAAATNIFLMSIYSMNNMPYAALGGVITGDANERARLNSLRFVLVNVAQFIVSGFTLPLVAKLSIGGNRQLGWQLTSMIAAALCLVLFVITFATTRERIQPAETQKRDLREELATLVRSSPWAVMFIATFLHFTALSLRGAALYGYYHHYADKTAMYDWLAQVGLVARTSSPGGILETLGLLVHGDRTDSLATQVADVFNSIVNMIGLGVTILALSLSPLLSRKLGKKAVAVVGLGLTGLGTVGFSLLGPTQVTAMIALTIALAVCYAPTIPLLWAIYADVVDYLEWTTGRRLTGIVFATIGFALKCGLALGSAGFLWIMAGLFRYDPRLPGTALAVAGFRLCNGVAVGLIFAACAALLSWYKIDKRMTLRIAAELPQRRATYPLVHPDTAQGLPQ